MWAAGFRVPAGAEAESALTRMSSGTGKKAVGEPSCPGFSSPRLTWAESVLSAGSQA